MELNTTLFFSENAYQPNSKKSDINVFFPKQAYSKAVRSNHLYSVPFHRDLNIRMLSSNSFVMLNTN